MRVSIRMLILNRWILTGIGVHLHLVADRRIAARIAVIARWRAFAEKRRERGVVERRHAVAAHVRVVLFGHQCVRARRTRAQTQADAVGHCELRTAHRVAVAAAAEDVRVRVAAESCNACAYYETQAIQSSTGVSSEQSSVIEGEPFAGIIRAAAQMASVNERISQPKNQCKL